MSDTGEAKPPRAEAEELERLRQRVLELEKEVVQLREAKPPVDDSVDEPELEAEPEAEGAAEPPGDAGDASAEGASVEAVAAIIAAAAAAADSAGGWDQLTAAAGDLTAAVAAHPFPLSAPHTPEKEEEEEEDIVATVEDLLVNVEGGVNPAADGEDDPEGEGKEAGGEEEEDSGPFGNLPKLGGGPPAKVGTVADALKKLRREKIPSKQRAYWQWHGHSVGKRSLLNQRRNQFRGPGRLGAVKFP